ncbi:hypothetical protein GQ457_13G017510 [Hibiscus cannabinus]
MTGYIVNVGEILSNELATLCQSDKGILAFPTLVTSLCRRVHTPMFDTDRFQAEKTGWTRVIYMRKMNVADATPLNMAMPTPPASPVPEADARAEDSAPPSPTEPPVAAEQTHIPPPSSPVIPERATEELHFSSDDENDVFDWQSPRDHLLALGPSTSTPAPVVPILSAAPTPTTTAAFDRLTPASPSRKRGKATAGRQLGGDTSSEEEAAPRPAKKRKYHIITAESSKGAVLGKHHKRQNNQKTLQRVHDPKTF